MFDQHPLLFPFLQYFGIIENVELTKFFPSYEQLTLKWIIFLFFGIIIGFQLREVVLSADPGHVLVGLDWGIVVGAIIYYTLRFAR